MCDAAAVADKVTFISRGKNWWPLCKDLTNNNKLEIKWKLNISSLRVFFKSESSRQWSVRLRARPGQEGQARAGSYVDCVIIK